MIIQSSNIIIPLFDLELQRLTGKHIDTIVMQKYIKVASLFFDSLVISPSFMLESETTEKLILDNRLLVEDGVVSLTMREESLSEFLSKKINSYESYSDTYSGLYRDWSSFELLFKANIIKRDNEIGKLIDASWLNELTSNDIFSLKNRIHLGLKSKPDAADRLISKLLVIPTYRDNKPFVWELIKDSIDINDVANSKHETCIIERIIRTHLLGIYFNILGESSNSHISTFAAIGFPEIDHLTKSRNISLNIIDKILRVLGIERYILEFRDEQLLNARYSLEFRAFKETCIALLADVNSENNVIEVYQNQIVRENNILTSSVSDLLLELRSKREKLLISSLLKALDNEHPNKLYKHPLIQGVLDKVPLLLFKNKVIEIYREECAKELFDFPNKFINSTKGDIKVTKFVFNNPTINNSIIGDNGVVNNYINNQTEISDNLVMLKDEVIKSDLVIKNDIEQLLQDFTCSLEAKKVTQAQSIWDQIKEGVKTSSAITTICFSISKLLGWI